MAVLNKHYCGIPAGAVYIGRPSKWGNPFAMRTELDRDYVIEKYRQWLIEKPSLVALARKELKGRDLVCFCAPLRCHGDVLHEVANSIDVNIGATQMPYQNDGSFIAQQDGEFGSPPLRFVQGDTHVAQEKNMDGKPYIGDDGKPYVKYFVAGAGRKGDPLVEAFKKLIETTAAAKWPGLFTGPGGACTHPSFSYKVIDGDGFDMNGKPNNTKEGFAGHWIFRFSTGYPPKVYPLGKYDPMVDQLKAGDVQRGYYIRVHGKMDSNKNTTKPGMALYHDLIELNMTGPIIISGPSAASVFGAAPAGGVAAPAPVLAPPPAVVLAPPPVAVSYQVSAALAAQGHTLETLRAQGQTDAVMLANGWIVAAAPAPAPVLAPPPVVVAPHPNILAPTGSVAPPPAPVAAPPAPTAGAAPGFKMRDPAGPTYSAYIAGGWTDAALIANQHMVPA